jgi:hypothetical protein
MGADKQTRPPSNLRSRLHDELIRYVVVSAYLYVCFGALILFKAAILRAHGVDFPILGLAIAKALVLGKFILMGRSLNLGERHRGKPLVYAVFYQVIFFAALLVVLSVIEEVVLALIHGRSIGEGLAHIAGSTWPEMLASCLLLCLILTPYFGLGAINDRLGDGRLRRMFLGENQTSPFSHQG